MQIQCRATSRSTRRRSASCPMDQRGAFDDCPRLLVACLAALASLLITTPTRGQATTRLSIGPDGGGGDADSARPSISFDGRHVAFESDATNLVAGDTNGVGDIFVHDREVGRIVRVSIDSTGAQADDKSGRPSISDDGRFIAFFSDASNLVEGDTPTFDALTCSTCTGARDVFVHDRDPDENGVFDEGNGETVRISVSSAGVPGNGNSTRPSISGDGRCVAFRSEAANLVDGDTNAVSDVFVYDLGTGQTLRVSESASGAQGNAKSDRPAISGDGRFVAFYSDSANLITGDTNGLRDVFVRHLETSSIVRVSEGLAGVDANGVSSRPAISTDGRLIAFRSKATNLVDAATNGLENVFILDRDPDENGIFDEGNGLIEWVSTRRTGDPNGDSSTPSLSSDGRYVAFHTDATNLVESDQNAKIDVLVLDRVTGELERVSVCGAGTEGNGDSERPSISGDGRFVAFHSQATNLIGNDSNGANDILIRDLAAGGDESECEPAPSPGPSTTPTSSRGGCGGIGMIAFVLLLAGMTTLRRQS